MPYLSLQVDMLCLCAGVTGTSELPDVGTKSELRSLSKSKSFLQPTHSPLTLIFKICSKNIFYKLSLEHHLIIILRISSSKI